MVRSQNDKKDMLWKFSNVQWIIIGSTSGQIKFQGTRDSGTAMLIHLTLFDHSAIKRSLLCTTF